MSVWREGDRGKENRACECVTVCVCVCVSVCVMHVCVMRVWRESDIEKGGRENRAWECMSVCVCVCVCVCVRAQRERMTETG